MILEEDNSLRLSEKDKETLKQWGETDEDIQQIERALNVTEFTVGDVERAENGSIVIPDEDNDRVITAQEAREILGDETFLSGLDRSAFHWTSGRYNADETKYVSFDSSKLFKDSELCEESKERFNCPECNEDINELFECDGKCECPECGHSGNKEDFRECINKKLKKENKKAIVEGKLNFIENVDELPDMCYGVLPSDNSIIIIKKGETGYYTTDYNDMVEGETYDERYHSANEVANNLNAEIDITPDQRFTMEIRSMNGNWNSKKTESELSEKSFEDKLLDLFGHIMPEKEFNGYYVDDTYVAISEGIGDEDGNWLPDGGYCIYTVGNIVFQDPKVDGELLFDIHAPTFIKDSEGNEYGNILYVDKTCDLKDAVNKILPTIKNTKFIDGDYLAHIDESKKEERNLTRAERHNRDAERIYDTYNKQIERFCEFLRRLGYDEDRITKARQNTGIGAHELWDLCKPEADKLGPDVWDKLCSLKVDMNEVIPEKKEERNLTRAERHNKNMEQIFDTYNKQIERFCEFLRRLGYDEDRITKARQNTGLGAHELWDLAQPEAEKLGPDVWDKVCNLSVDMDEIVPAK